MSIDLLSMSAHKTYGPKGVGALYVRRRNPKVKISPIIFGGGHERGLRSGTLNVPGIVGFAEALKIASKEMEKEAKRLGGWTSRMLEEFKAQLGDVDLNGHPSQRLPHNLNVYFKGIESKALIQSIHNEIAVSAGSACTTDMVEPSHVLISLGFGEERAHSSIRFGLGRFNTQEEVRYAIECVPKAILRLQKIKT
jgi:cysteine desulfurase